MDAGSDAGDELDAGTEDGGTSADGGVTEDAGSGDASAEDASRLEDGSSPDAGAPEGSQAAEPAEVIRTGASGLLLRGTVLTHTGVLERGEVLISADTITCVAVNCIGAQAASTPQSSILTASSRRV